MSRQVRQSGPFRWLRPKSVRLYTQGVSEITHQAPKALADGERRVASVEGKLDGGVSFKLTTSWQYGRLSFVFSIDQGNLVFEISQEEASELYALFGHPDPDAAVCSPAAQDGSGDPA